MAAVWSGPWGAVTQRARQRCYSRTSIYNHVHSVVQAMFYEQAGGVSYEALLEDHERLRAEKAALW